MHIQEKACCYAGFFLYIYMVLHSVEPIGADYSYLSEVLLTAIVSISTNAPIGSLATW